MILRTSGNYNLAGYAKIYLGSKGELIGSILIFVFLYSVLLVYIVIGGEFIRGFAADFGWNLGINAARFIIWFIIALVSIIGNRFIAKIESLLLLLFVVSIILIIIIGIPHIHSNNIFHYDLAHIMDPYGVMIFAFCGFSAFPFALKVLGNEKRYLKHAIIGGVIICAIFFSVFATVIVGITGLQTSPDSLSGLKDLPARVVQISEIMTTSRVLRLILLFFFGEAASLILIQRILRLTGTASVSAATVIYGNSLSSFFKDDWGINKHISSIIIMLLFVSVIFMGTTSFISIMSMVGAIVDGAIIILIIILYNRARDLGKRVPEYSIRIPRFFTYLMIIFFAIGFIFTFIRMF